MSAIIRHLPRSASYSCCRCCCYQRPWSYALTAQRRHAKHRALNPDDPFGEKGSWDDPSIFGAWQHVDEERFVAAADTAEVRTAHFGPEWAKFSTVGRLAAQGMARVAPLDRVPTAEEVHEKALRERRHMLEKNNYDTYEAFIGAELGESEVVNDGGDCDTDGLLYTAAGMEEAFAASVDGRDARDRLAQRNPERAALQEMEAAVQDDEDEGEEEKVGVPSIDLPQFMRATNGVPAVHVTDAAVHQKENVLLTSASPQRRGDVPALFRDAITAMLPYPHCDVRLPHTDPLHWNVDTVVLFLCLFEQHRNGMNNDASTTANSGGGADFSVVMDESMRETFLMAKVDGNTLLRVATPPRLFQTMRRWYVRREAAVTQAWRQHNKNEDSQHLNFDNNTSCSDKKDLFARAAASVVRESIPLLEESVAGLDACLIQETILQCFSYGH